MLFIVEYLKAFACLLITHFHTDILLPPSIASLAFGGDIGNNIFFAVSGFTLYSSISHANSKDFLKWYAKRVSRIVPLVLFFDALSIALGYASLTHPIDIVKVFIYPTLFWFAGAILLLYPLLFWAGKIPKLLPLLIIAIITSHLILDNQFVEQYGIGLLAMLLGCMLRGYFETEQDPRIPSTKTQILLCVTSFCVYVGLKLLKNRSITFYGLTHLGIGVMTVIIAILLLSIGYVNDDRLKHFSGKHTCIYKFVLMISRATLSAYLVQSFGNRLLFRFVGSTLKFPLSYITGVVLVLAIACVLTWLEAKIRRGIQEVKR